MRNLSVKAVTILIAGLVLAGCVTDDPSRGGVLGGVGGLMSGQYQRNIEAREKALEQERGRSLALERSASRILEDASTTRRKLAQAEQLLAELDDGIVKIRRRLNVVREQANADQIQLNKLEDDLVALEADIQREKLRFGYDDAMLKRLAELQRNKLLLEEAIAAAAGG